MRALKPAGRCAVRIIGLALVTITAHGAGVTPPTAQSSTLTGDQLIAKAQQWIGGADRIAQVKSLEFVGTQTTHKILFPNRFQIISSAGSVISSFDGREVWSRPSPKADPQRAGALEAAVRATHSPPTAEEMRRRGINQVGSYSLKYLLTPLPEQKLRVKRLPDGECARLVSACLELEGENGVYALLALDPTTGQPMAMVNRSTGPRGVLQTAELLDDYRTVGGLKFPFKLMVRTVLPNGVTRDDPPETFRTVRVNPPLREVDFSKR